MSSPMLKVANSELELDEQGLGIRDVTENYYDSDDANAFYSNIGYPTFQVGSLRSSLPAMR